MKESYFGSIDYDRLIEALKQGKIKTYISENGKRYIPINVNVREMGDKYNNIASVSCPLKEEFKKDKETRVFIANLKKSEPTVREGSASDFMNDDDFPF